MPRRTKADAARQNEQVSSDHQLTSTYRDLVDILREQLQAAHAREQAYRDHIAQLTAMLHEAQHRADRLLDAPRAVPPAESPVATRVVSPGSAPFPTRGAARQRILALLREYPVGLTAAELRVLLGAEKSLTNTCTGMFKDGLLRRVGRGRYALL